jgi:hypothetical protein
MADRDRLPERFPVGTRYVVEGRPGKDGKLTIISRRVILPNGDQIALPTRPERVKRPALRQVALRPAERRTKRG